MSNPPFDYMLFGLRVRSELELPELPELPRGGGSVEPDVWVRSSRIAIDRGAAGMSVEGEAMLLTIDDVGRYHIAGGSEIMVEANEGVDPRNVRLFLLGSAFGALLHQRGLLPLHANAVEIEGRAVAFMGPSGAGKSTLAAWLEDRGHQILTDDVCVVDFPDDSAPAIHPGLARIRLWREAVERRGRRPSDYHPSFIGHAGIDKFDVPVATPPAADACVPLACVYLLARGESGAITRLTGVDAFDAVSANTYRGHYIEMGGSAARHWSAAVELVRRTPMFRAERTWGLERFDDECARLRDHAIQIVRG